MADDTSTSSRADGSQTGAAEKPAAAFDLANNQPSDISSTNSNGNNITNEQQDQPSSNKNKQQKASKWKTLKNQKKKKEPWFRNRGEKKRLKQEAAEGDMDGSNKKPKTNHWKKDWDATDPKSPHEGSFAHPEMQRLFGVHVDVPLASTEDAKSIAESDGKSGEDTATKIPKRKLGILVSFLGTNYSGFQINSTQHTLQAAIELGLFKAGLISPSNFGWPSKYSWSNSARTDKGVHAAAQVVSMKGEMIFHSDTVSIEDQLNAMREKVNEHLPNDIRVLDIERVTRAFCARTNRDKVRYQYMVPSFMFSSREEICCAFGNIGETAIEDAKSRAKITPMEASNIVQDAVTDEVMQQARSKLIGYRVNDDQMERLRSGLKVFEGTHTFHNYTRRLGSDNASASRYIISFAPLDPIVVDGTEWIPVQIVGQSFLLNQIRKMISAAVDLARGTVTHEQIQQSLKKGSRMKVNVAPAQGLFLDRSYFELYNKQKSNALNHDPRPLNWVEGDGDIPPVVRRVEEFKNEKIIPHIVREEAKEGNFLKYIFSQDVLYAKEVYSVLGKDGEKSRGSDVEGSNGDE